MATILVTKSGTLNPGAGRIDNDDTTTTAYAAGDVLSVSAGAQLKINTSTAARLPGMLQANSTTAGTIFVENTSTSTPIVVSLNLQTADILVTGRSLFKVRGDWIVVKTGDGTASQTIDFSSIGGVSIDYPPCVWVETGDSKHKQITVGGTPGYFMPFFNCGEATDTAAINILTDFYGDLDHGPVFQFDRTTKIATFGKGGAVSSSLGGAVIPNGARVIYPNIHFTSSTFDSTESARNELRINNSGSADLRICAFSRSWTIGRGVNGSSYAGETTFLHVAYYGRGLVNASVGPTSFDNVCSAPECQSTTLVIGVQITSCTADVSVDFLWALTKNTTTSYAISLDGYKVNSIGSLFGWWISTSTSTSQAAVYISGLVGNSATDAPLLIGPIHSCGGSLQLSANNCHVVELNHSDMVSAVSSGSVVKYVFNLNGAISNATLAKLRKMTNGAVTRGFLISVSPTVSRYAIKDVIYDCANNASDTIRTGGAYGYAANILCTNMRTSLLAGTRLGVKGCRVSNVKGNQPTLANVSVNQGGFYEWALGSTSSWTGTAGCVDGSPFNCLWTSSDYTQGSICIGPMRSDSNEEHLTVVSGVEGTDWYDSKNGVLYCEGNGVELIYTATFPIRGITDFTGASWTATGTNYNTNATYEFSMRLPDDVAAWGSWYDATTAVNWQTALAALSGYSSNAGFFLRFRIKTSAALAGRAFQYARISCTTDAAWTPAEIGFVPIKPTGLVANSTVRLMVNTVPATPVTVKIKSIAGSSEVLDFPYDFDAQPKAYRIVARKAGYLEASVSGNTYQAGRDVAISQQQIVAVDEVAAAALTGISISGATATVTVSSNHSLSELYAYCQWWAMQVANMAYEIPLVTTNGVDYSSSYNFVINPAVAITGTGSINLADKILTMGATASSTVDWTYSSGTKTWTRISLAGIVSGSRIQVYNTTSSTEIYNNIVIGSSLEIQMEWTTNQNIRIRAGYCVGTLAKLPYSIAGVFKSTGLSVLLNQVDDTVYNSNAIDGSTITEFAADFPNVQIDVSDPDGVTTPQRGYAWYIAGQMTADGIANFHGAMLADDSVNFRIVTSVANMYIQNVSANPCIIAGGRLYRDDDKSIFAAGSGPIQADPGRSFIAPFIPAPGWRWIPIPTWRWNQL